MTARWPLAGIAAMALCCVAASHRTRNFVVHAPTPEIAQQVALKAEACRKTLALEWIGQEMHPWTQPCPIRVKIGQIGSGGQTNFNFAGGEVYGWDMFVQGTLDGVLDSVIPHEVSHTILACHFRCPLPRWADEGAATLAEHESERRRQELTVRQVMSTPQRIPLRKLMSLMEYPEDMKDVLTLYAQGYSLADLLVKQGGRARYLRFLKDSMHNGWDGALTRHYGYKSIEEFEGHWMKWVSSGNPEVPNNLLLVQSQKNGAATSVPGSTAPAARGKADAASINSQVAATRHTPPAGTGKGSAGQTIVRGQNSDQDLLSTGASIAGTGSSGGFAPVSRTSGAARPSNANDRLTGEEVRGRNSAANSRLSSSSIESELDRSAATLAEEEEIETAPDREAEQNSLPENGEPVSRLRRKPLNRNSETVASIQPIDIDNRSPLRTAELTPKFDRHQQERSQGQIDPTDDTQTGELGHSQRNPDAGHSSLGEIESGELDLRGSVPLEESGNRPAGRALRSGSRGRDDDSGHSNPAARLADDSDDQIVARQPRDERGPVLKSSINRAGKSAAAPLSPVTSRPQSKISSGLAGNSSRGSMRSNPPPVKRRQPMQSEMAWEPGMDAISGR